MIAILNLRFRNLKFVSNMSLKHGKYHTSLLSALVMNKFVAKLCTRMSSHGICTAEMMAVS